MRSSSPAVTSSERGIQSRTRATTSAPAATRCRTSQPPTRPVAPVTNTGRSRQNVGDVSTALFPGVNVNRLLGDVACAQILADAAEHRRRAGEVVLHVERTWQSRPDRVDRETAGIDAVAPTLLLYEITHVEGWQACGTTLDEVAVDQQIVRACAIREGHRLLRRGGHVVEKRGERGDARTAREQHDVGAAVDHEIPIRQLDPHLSALHQIALHSGGELAVHRIGEPDEVAVCRRTGNREPPRLRPEATRVVGIERQVEKLAGAEPWQGSLGPE